MKEVADFFGLSFWMHILIVEHHYFYLNSLKIFLLVNGTTEFFDRKMQPVAFRNFRPAIAPEANGESFAFWKDMIKKLSEQFQPHKLIAFIIRDSVSGLNGPKSATGTLESEDDPVQGTDRFIFIPRVETGTTIIHRCNLYWSRIFFVCGGSFNGRR